MKWRVFVSWCLVIVLLCACTAKRMSENEKYAIYQKEGNWYMEFYSDFSEDKQSSQLSTHVSIAKEYPRFESISDMKNKIMTGNIPERQIAALQGDSTNNVLGICNPNDLCDLTSPGDLTYDYILWYGDTYSFEFDRTDFLGYFMCCDEEAFYQQFEENYAAFSNENCSVFSDKTISDRNAREVLYMTHNAMLKDILYDFSVGQTKIYVVERYALAYFGDDVNENEISESVPKSIRIFGNNGSDYFYGWIKGFDERPTIEWLGCFGLESVANNVES